MRKLNFFAKILIVCLALLKAASTTPQSHRASDGRDYLIEADLKYNWYQAWHECARRNAQLVAIDTAAKNDVIINLLKNVIGRSHDLWLGGNDEYNNNRDNSRPFFWAGTGEKFTFTFWSDNNPDNYRHQEHCVHIWGIKPRYHWNDIPCTTKMGFICEVNQYFEAQHMEVRKQCEAAMKSNDLQWELKWQKIQNNTQTALQKILTGQENMAKQLTENILKQIDDAALRNSSTDTNTKFNKKKLNSTK